MQGKKRTNSYLSAGKGDFSYNRRGVDSYDSFNGNDRGDRDTRSGGNSNYRNNYRDKDSRGDSRSGGYRNGGGWNDRNRSSGSASANAQSPAPRNSRWQMDTRHGDNEWIVPLSRDERMEEELFGTGNTGINFNKYEDIPVEATGDDVPSPINSVGLLKYLGVDVLRSSINVEKLFDLGW